MADHLLEMLYVSHMRLDEVAVLSGDPVALDHLPGALRSSSATFCSWPGAGRMRMIVESVRPSARGSISRSIATDHAIALEALSRSETAGEESPLASPARRSSGGRRPVARATDGGS